MPHFLRWFVLPCCLAILASCDDDSDEKTETIAPVRRTVLIYVSAQNSLGYKNFQTKDSIEIVKGRQFIDDNDRLLVYMDDERAPRIYQYTKETYHPKLVRTWEKDVNSSDPNTLKDVLSWTKANYPAEDYGLVMWSHSDGWVPSTNKNYSPSTYASTYSFGIDVNADGNMKYDQDCDGNIGAQMDIEDMAFAIQNSGVHLKYIFFDSCLMQNIECAYTLRNVTDFVIGAPMQIPGCGANYTHMLKKGLFTQAEYDIVDTYSTDAIEGYYDKNDEYYDFGLVISSIRTDKLEALAQTTADVLSRSSIKGKKSADLNSVLNYQNYSRNYFYRPHNYDAQEAMRQILNAEDFVKFQNALNDAIVKKGATEEFWIGPYYSNVQTVDLNRYCGVSMFIPQEIYSDNQEVCAYGNLNGAFQSTTWYKAAGWSVTGW